MKKYNMSDEFKTVLKKKNIQLCDSWVQKFKFEKPKNGKKCKKTFKGVFDNYCNLHLPTLSESSRVMKLRRCTKFIKPLENIYIQDITTEIVNEFMLFTKIKHKESYNKAKKYNFDKQLKDLKSIFNNYIESYDPSYYNPIKKVHFRMGILEEIPKKERQITEYEVLKFMDNLKQPYKDIATIALYSAGRIGEVAGIQVKNIDLKNRKLHIKEVLVWINGKPKIKNCPKNGSSRVVFINDTMAKILKRKIKEKNDCSPFLFEKNGKALRYNAINEAYMRAWKKSGLYPKFSGTHLLRYAGAQVARKVCGSIDAAMAVTGHKSIRMAEKYSQFNNHDLNKQASLKMQNFLKEAEKNIA